ncbi:MAG: histidine phosphatase family protein, partial [Synergistales bacterium]|nr:histidine phosphatase family protein [Synergistales bacterium]
MRRSAVQVRTPAPSRIGKGSRVFPRPLVSCSLLAHSRRGAFSPFPRPATPLGGADVKHRRLLLARHGRTDWNRTFRYQGTTDVPLDDGGREQARRLGLRLKREPLVRIVASPLVRAVETASLVSSSLLEAPPTTHSPQLVELDFGLWEGLSVAEVMERHGDLYRAWREDPFSVEPPGGEPFLSAVDRVGKALAPLLH